MKIALCYSGQPRTWRKCHEGHMKFIDRLKSHFGAEVDVFCHAWDFNTLPHALLAKPGEENKPDFLRVTAEMLSEEEKAEIIQAYKPKSFLFENQAISKQKNLDLYFNALKNINEHGSASIEFAGSQFYAVMRSAALKKKYEFDNDFRYDMCIRIRYDLQLNDHQTNWFFSHENTDARRPRYNTFYACHIAKDHDQFPYHRLGDAFWYADSVTFDRTCDFYRWIPIIGTRSFNGSQIKTENVLYFYAKMLRMSVYPLTFDPKLCRQDDYLEQRVKAGLDGELQSNDVI
jgi:hypothetical protein